MAEDVTLCDDPLGEIIDQPAMDLVELCWHDATEAMSAGQVYHRLAVSVRQVTT
jgi:hypothetical protein